MVVASNCFYHCKSCYFPNRCKKKTWNGFSMVCICMNWLFFGFYDNGNENSATDWCFVYLFGLKYEIFTEVILWCGVVCRRKEINVQNHNERTDHSVGESCVHHNCLEVTRPLMNGSMSPSRTEFKSDNWIPVLRSWTNLWGPNVYLRVSELHLSSIACLLISFTSDTLNSLATRRSFAFNLLVAFSLFAK